MLRLPITLLLVLLLCLACAGPARHSEPGSRTVPPQVRGWTILSDHESGAMEVIARAPAYDVNHLQLSHDIVHDLREVRDTAKRGLTRRLTAAAHRAGIHEVVVWDHALYDLS